MAEKTHDPTPKRLREAREKGDVPHAPLVAGAIGLFALVPLARSAIVSLGRGLARSLNDLSPVESIDASSIAITVVSGVAPIAITLIMIAVVSGIVQGTITFSPARLSPDPSRLIGGFGKLVDKSKLWGAARGLAAIVIVGLLAGRWIVEAAAQGARNASLETAGNAASRVILAAAGVGCAIAIVDVVIARRIWLGRHRMSRDEVVREHKEQEGDPEIKRRREELHHELLAAEALTAVRDATVLVVNPTHLACALQYDGADEESAPKLLAKGQGALAARMIEAARLHGVPVIRDVPVARALFELETGTEIPEALYEAVAEVLKSAWEGEGD
ncbi:MAG: EscU/YscU/HrcU family type III secretion system export apparatus switch protein [Polyangiales bacterium]